MKLLSAAQFSTRISRNGENPRARNLQTRKLRGLVPAGGVAPSIHHWSRLVVPAVSRGSVPIGPHMQALRRGAMSCHAMPCHAATGARKVVAMPPREHTQPNTQLAMPPQTQHTLTQHMLATIQPQPRHDITAQYALVALHRCAAQSGTRSDRRRHGRRHGLGRRLRYCGPREAPRYVAPIRRRVGGPFGSGDPR